MTKERKSQIAKLSYEKHKDRILLKHKIYRNLNKDKIRIQTLEYYNKNKDRILESKKIYRSENKSKKNLLTARRRAAKRSATPKWITKEHTKQMQSFYDQCYNGYQVDHIIPLAGKDICGLHVPWNLQILTAEENIKKGNRVDATAQAFAFLNNNV